MIRITASKKYRFCASHRLASAALSREQNAAIYGKCNNPHGHGHDYTLDVSVDGELEPRTGLVVKWADLDALVQAEVLKPFGYRNLNLDVPEFATLVPTTENLAVVIADRLTRGWAKSFPHSAARLSRIHIQETERNSFEILLRDPVAAMPESWRESVVSNA